MVLQGKQPCQHLHFRLPASGAVRQCTSVVEGTQVMVPCYSSPGNHTPLKLGCSCDMLQPTPAVSTRSLVHPSASFNGLFFQSLHSPWRTTLHTTGQLKLPGRKYPPGQEPVQEYGSSLTSKWDNPRGVFDPYSPMWGQADVGCGDDDVGILLKMHSSSASPRAPHWALLGAGS